jgi:hypothetical protein
VADPRITRCVFLSELVTVVDPSAFLMILVPLEVVRTVRPSSLLDLFNVLLPEEVFVYLVLLLIEGLKPL